MSFMKTGTPVAMKKIISTIKCPKCGEQILGNKCHKCGYLIENKNKESVVNE